MPLSFDDAHREALNEFRVYTPRFVWLLFVVCEFLVFLDRGMATGVLEQIRTDPSISDSNSTVLSSSKAGALNSVFIAGFVLTAPLAAHLAGYVSTRTVLTISMLIWSGSACLTGAAPDYPTLVVARIFTGVAEAALYPFAVTTIDNIAPPEKRAAWIGIFYAMIPLGSAFGVALGAIFGSHVPELADGTPGWRQPFLIMEPILGAVVSLVVVFLPQDYNVYDLDATAHRDSDVEDRREGHGVEHGDYHIPLLTAAKELIKNPDFIMVSLAYSAWSFFTGAVTALLLVAIHDGRFIVPEMTAGLAVGAVMGFGGITGAFLMGKLIDRYAPASDPKHIAKALLFNVVAALLAIPLSAGSLLSQTKAQFFGFVVPGVIFFIAQMPAQTVALLGVVPSHLRPYSISVSLLIMHGLGDVLSSPVVGALAPKFAGICDGLKTELSCSWFDFSNETSYGDDHTWLDGECRWIEAKHRGDDSYCVNTMQLQKALLIALAYSGTMIIWWLIVAFRQGCCRDDEAADSQHYNYHQRSSAADLQALGAGEQQQQQQNISAKSKKSEGSSENTRLIR